MRTLLRFFRFVDSALDYTVQIPLTAASVTCFHQQRRAIGERAWRDSSFSFGDGAIDVQRRTGPGIVLCAIFRQRHVRLAIAHAQNPHYVAQHFYRSATDPPVGTGPVKTS